MSRYDGLIIPRSYSEYINKTDAATLQQALQLSGVLDAIPTPNSNKAVKSGGVKNNCITLQKTVDIAPGETATISLPHSTISIICWGSNYSSLFAIKINGYNSAKGLSSIIAQSAVISNNAENQLSVDVVNNGSGLITCMVFSFPRV